MRDVYADVLRRLEDIRESLVDISISALQEAVESGAVTRPTSDKKLAQATRAIEKAIESVKDAAASED
jgi:predicted RNA-binding protein associated with RNAse of E/G family